MSAPPRRNEVKRGTWTCAVVPTVRRPMELVRSQRSSEFLVSLFPCRVPGREPCERGNMVLAETSSKSVVPDNHWVDTEDGKGSKSGEMDGSRRCRGLSYFDSLAGSSHKTLFRLGCSCNSSTTHAEKRQLFSRHIIKMPRCLFDRLTSTTPVVQWVALVPTVA